MLYPEVFVFIFQSAVSLQTQYPYQAAEAQGEMVTVVLRLVVYFLSLEKNADAVVGILENSLGMSEEAKPYVKGLITALTDCLANTTLGMDAALYTIYYIFYGVDIGVDNTTSGYDSINEAWRDALDELKKESSQAGAIVDEILSWDIFEDIIDTETGLAPNGIIAFFQKIISFFKGITEFFRNLFN